MTQESQQNYLKQIYELALDEVPVRTSRIATALGVSAAAVTEMLKRLESHGLVTYTPYHGVELTDQGRLSALEVIRRHRLWEVFLHRELGVPWPRVHAHACQLEHATDEELAGYLDRYLGHPRTDPHGDPIPDATGVMAEVDRLRLTDLSDGTVARVVQCTNEDPAMLDHLDTLGLVPGARVLVLGRAPFGGPISLKLKEKESSVGLEVAQTLLVEAIAD